MPRLTWITGPFSRSCWILSYRYCRSACENDPRNWRLSFSNRDPWNWWVT